MASTQSDTSLVKSELSRRNKLYSKINDNLSENEIRKLRAMLVADHHIAIGRIENATPHEIFTMLENDNKISEGSLGLLKELLTALNESRLAQEVVDLELEESSGEDGLYYSNLRGTRGRPSLRGWKTRDQENMETDTQFESADVSLLHHNLGFEVGELKPKAGMEPVQGSSIPLILPNDLRYNASTGEVEKVPGAQRATLHAVPEALELLEGIEEPVSVLAICGPCRTGKSYILSRLLGTVDAFALGHRMDPQTFGIWMGTKVLRGKDFTIVLLDTEGIDAVGSSAVQDVSILVLTILLSSCLIYNSTNVPYKRDLEQMQCFTQLAKGLTVKQGEKIQVSAFHEFFPDFLWLLRDVSKKMEDDDGKDMTPTEYLMTKVLKRDPDDFEESTSDKVGRAILTFFPSVECAKLVPPSGNTEVMNNIAQHTDKLNPEFNKGVENLIMWLLRKSRAKKGYDKASIVSGVALSIMAKEYVCAVNDPKSIPALDNTWQNTIELMRVKAIEEVVEEYNLRMQSQVASATNSGQVPLEESPENEVNLNPVIQGRGRRRTRGRRRQNKRNPPSQPTLMDLHNKSLNEATETLLEKVGHLGTSSGDRSSENQTLVDRMQKRLVQRKERSVDYEAAHNTVKGFVVTGGELIQYIQQNKELSKRFCQKLFESLFDPIRINVESPPPGYDLQKLTKELKEARQQYEEQARGPEKWNVLQEMTKNVEKLRADIEKIEGYQIEILQLQQKEHQANLKAKEMARENQQLRKQTKDMMKAQQQTLQKMERLHRKQIEEMKQELDKRLSAELRKIQDLKTAKMDEQAKMAFESLKKESSKMRERIKKMEQERADFSRRLKELKDRENKKPSSPTNLLQGIRTSKQGQDMQPTHNLQKKEQLEAQPAMKRSMEEGHGDGQKKIKTATMEEQVEKPKVDNKAESSETTKEQQRAESNRQLEELKDQDVKEPPQPPSSPPLASSSAESEGMCTIL